MVEGRTPRSLTIVSLLIAFGLGILFGALAARNPRQYLPRPQVAPPSSLPSDTLADGDPPSPLRTFALQDEPDSVPGDGTATAPPGYPVKGNGRSGIYHVPGGFAYERTVATTCYRTVAAAEAAGLRASKS